MTGKTDGLDRQTPRVYLCGTNPNAQRGGIAFVMSGYANALREAGLKPEIIVTYEPGSLTGKWKPWFHALREARRKAQLCRDSNVPVVFCSHAGSLVSMIRESILLRTVRAAGAATMMHLHSSEVNGYLAHRLGRAVMRVLLKPADRVIPLSDWWKQRIDAAGLSVRTTAIPNPVTPHLAAVAAGRIDRPANDTIRVLTLTRLVEGKGVDDTIRALARLPSHVHLDIAGAGEQRAALERQISDLRLTDRVRFLGWVNGAAKHAAFCRADIFCLPTVYDNYPMSIVEAMAYGLPIVAARHQAIPDIVPHDRAGLLVTPDDVEGLAAALQRLLDADTRALMGEGSRLTVMEKSGPAVVGNRIKQVIGQLLDAREKPGIS